MKATFKIGLDMLIPEEWISVGFSRNPYVLCFLLMSVSKEISMPFTKGAEYYST